jgi:[2Fe-2S] binding domain
VKAGHLGRDPLTIAGREYHYGLKLPQPLSLPGRNVRVPRLRGLHRLGRRRAEQRPHVPAFEASGTCVTTIEGLAPEGHLDPLQETFIQRGAAQCGLCTSGMLLACRVLLQEYPQPTRAQIGRYLNGNICRRGAYVQILEAIRRRRREARRRCRPVASTARLFSAPMRAIPGAGFTGNSVRSTPLPGCRTSA